MTEQHRTAIAAVPIFSGLDDEALEEVTAIATEFDVRAGHMFIDHGQPATGCFIVLDGTVRVEPASGSPIERGPGDFFGELSVLIDTPRTARVVAVSPVEGLAIGRDDLVSLLEHRPAIALAMLREVARRLADVTRS